MKKIVLATLAVVFLGACGLIPTSANSTPAVVIESPTSAPTQTDTALPTETPALVTETFTSTPEAAPLNPTITLPPADSLTTTPATATLLPVIDTATAVSFPSSATPSPTLGILTYGTLPPAVPYNTVHLVNKAKAEAYISLQQQDGREAIIEYPVKGQIAVDIPTGQYIYVAWVGGKKMTGSFKINSFDTVYIFLFKDRIVVEKS